MSPFARAAETAASRRASLSFVSGEPMPLSPRQCLPPGACLLILVAGACAGRQPSEPATLEHDHGNTMVTLNVKSDRIAPSSDVTIPLYSAVCWIHGAAAGTPIEVELSRSPGVCGSCATIIGFGTKDGMALTNARVAPSSAALICFHETGEFHYTIKGLERPLEGTIRVEGPKAGKP